MTKDYNLCGVFNTDMGGMLEDICYKRYQDGKVELFCNNDPYGIISIYGLEDLEVESFEKYEYVIEDGEERCRNTETYDYFCEAITKDIRAKDTVGLVLLKDGLLVIKSLMPFEAVIQPLKLGTRPDEEYTGFADVSDVDEEDDEYGEIALLFSSIY